MITDFLLITDLLIFNITLGYRDTLLENHWLF